jgi:hypothetical protein
MPFAQLGAPGIEVLRSPGQVRHKVLEESQATSGTRYSCDVWDYFFTTATGVEGPDVSHGCYAGNDRGQAVSFEHWFRWLRRQR